MSILRLLALCSALAFTVAACSDDHPNDSAPTELSVEIDEKGGTLAVQGVTLVIPAGALDKKVKISATQLDEGKVPPSSKDVQAARVSPVYEFGPKGIVFAKEIEVQFDTQKPEAGGKVFFTKEGSESEFEQLVSETKDTKVSAKTKHFSLGFVGVPFSGAVDSDAGTGLDAGGGTDMGPGTGGRDGGLVGMGPDGGVVLGPRTIVVTSLDRWNRPANQAWAAFQDGDGPWTRITASTVGTYSFVVNSGRYGFAYMCSNAGSSDGRVLYAPSTSDKQTIEVAGVCSPTAPMQSTMNGNAIASEVGEMQFVHSFDSGSIQVMTKDTLTPFSISSFYTGVTTDLIYLLRAGGAVTKMDAVRNFTPAATESGTFDLQTKGMGPDFAVANLTGSTAGSFDVQLRTKGSRPGLGASVISPPTSDGAGGLTTLYAMVPSAIASPDDRYVAFASENTATNYREVELISAGGPITIALPAMFTPTDISEVGAGYYGASMTFDDVPGATVYELQVYFSTGLLTMTTEVGWFQDGKTSHTVVFPDLSGVDMFDPAWVPADDATPVDLCGSVTSKAVVGNGTRRAYASHTATLTIQP